MHTQITNVARSALLSLRGLSKRYDNGTMANSQISLDIHAGEIHAIIGENGAGKSTLIKMLYGLEQPSSGAILFNGNPIELRKPSEAIARGIGLVPQHLQLVPSFTVLQNIVLGSEPMRWIVLDHAAAVQKVQQVMQRFGLDIELDAITGSLPIGVQQRIEILKVLYRGASIVMLDEPTAVLTQQESQSLFDSLRKMTRAGLTVILITHKLYEIREVSDRFTVLRGGKVVGSAVSATMDEQAVTRMIVGKELPPPAQRQNTQASTTALLQVRQLSVQSPNAREVLHDMTFDIAAGEVLGVAGVEGNGQDVLAQVLSGLRRPSQGSASVDGKCISGIGVRAARAQGLAMIPEDRLHDGMAAAMSLTENAMAATYHQPPLSRWGWLNMAAARALASRIMQSCKVAAASPELAIGQLSGGNMQKLIVGRELATRPRLLIASQPTRGVDIGAAAVLRQQLLALRDSGSAILLISADLDEVLALSDRIIVMVRGEIVAHFSAAQAGTGILGAYMTGALREANVTAKLDTPFTSSMVSPSAESSIKVSAASAAIFGELA